MSASALPLLDARRLQLQGAPSGHAFDFTLNAGERWLIRGPIDAARTFFIKTLAGLLPAAGGSLRIAGVDAEQCDPYRLLAHRRQLGVVLERDGLIPAWTGAENLALPLRYHDCQSEAEIARRIGELRDRYSIPSAWLDHPVAELTGPRRSALALLRVRLIAPLAILVEDLPLQAIADSGGHGFEQLLIDIFAGPYAIILTQPVAEHSRLPGCMETIPFRQARLADGILQEINGA